MIEYYIENPKLLSIRFEHDPETVRLVKRLPGRYYDGETKKWLMPLAPALYDPILLFEEETHSNIPAYVIKALLEAKQFMKTNFIGSSAIAPNYNELERISPLFADKLRPYQQAGVLYMLKNRTVIVADEMGLGKTIEALATLESARSFPALIICPNSLKINWYRECKKWIPKRPIYVVENGNNDDAISSIEEVSAQIVICNYEMSTKHKWLSQVPWSCLIVDEAHYIKNSKSERTRNILSISRQAERVILITGTPIINHPFDLVSLLEVSRKLALFGGFWNFTQEYCDAQKTQFGWDFTGSSNLDELNVKLRECGYLRREKKNILTELPEKIRQDLYIEIDNKKEYKLAKEELIKYLIEYKDEESARRAMRAKILVGINTLRQVAIEGKIASVFEWIIDFQETGKSIIVFGWHKEVLEAIGTKFSCDVLNGDTSIKDRQGMVDRFQNGETKMIAINILSGGVGLTLTAASYELFVELPWTSAALEQAEDRAHRIGQKETLSIYRAIGIDTIDETFIKMIEKKKGVSEEAVNNTAAIDFLIQEMLTDGG